MVSALVVVSGGNGVAAVAMVSTGERALTGEHSSDTVSADCTEIHIGNAKGLIISREVFFQFYVSGSRLNEKDMNFEVANQ